MKRYRAAVARYAFGACALLCTTAASAVAAADDVSFAGKTVTMTIGNAAGGGTDIYGRALGRYLMVHLPGRPTLVVLNQPGAGGVIALNSWVNRAKPDGLSVTIGAQSQTDPASLIETHAKYDPATFSYVGGIGAHSQALFIGKNAEPHLHDTSAPPAIMGIVGSTLRGGTYQALWGAAFLGWNVKWVHGYGQSAELRQALERGEVDMTSFGSVIDIKHLLAMGNFAVASQTGAVMGDERVPLPMLGNAPVIGDLIEGKITDPLAQKAYDYWDNVSQIGSWLALPPKTPAPIVATYVRAFEATVRDPLYRSAIEKIAPDSPVVRRPQLESLVEKLGQVSPEVLNFLEEETKRQGVN